MSRVLTANAICARALRAIGAFPITESAPDGEHLREAMHWLDLLMGQKVGTGRMFSRVTESLLSLSITNGTQSYDLFSALGDNLPTDRIQYVINAWIEDDGGNRYPLEIVDQIKFENVSDPDRTGVPDWIYVDASAAPTLSVYPTPDVNDSSSYSIKMRCQLYAPNVAPGGVTGTQPSGSVLHNLGQAWQRWLVCQLSHDLGMGPVAKLPEASLNRFKGAADEAQAMLDAFENRTHATTPPIVEAWGMI